MRSDLLLVAKQITKTFVTPVPIQILCGIDLELHRGETIALIGASGGGKSTLLHLLGALDMPTTGEVSILGQTITGHNSAELRNTSIGFMFQAFYLLEDYTAMENALMPACIGRKEVSSSSPTYQRVEKLMYAVGLQHRMHHHTKLLSGGEKQRLALVRALCNDPDILIADEPTGSLDHSTAQELYHTIQMWAYEQQKGLIIATHDLELARRCQKMYLLKEGRLHQI